MTELDVKEFATKIKGKEFFWGDRKTREISRYTDNPYIRFNGDFDISIDDVSGECFFRFMGTYRDGGDGWATRREFEDIKTDNSNCFIECATDLEILDESLSIAIQKLGERV